MVILYQIAVQDAHEQKISTKFLGRLHLWNMEWNMEWNTEFQERPPNLTSKIRHLIPTVWYERGAPIKANSPPELLLLAHMVEYATRDLQVVSSSLTYVGLCSRGLFPHQISMSDVVLSLSKCFSSRRGSDRSRGVHRFQLKPHFRSLIVLTYSSIPVSLNDTAPR